MISEQVGVMVHGCSRIEIDGTYPEVVVVEGRERQEGADIDESGAVE